MFVITLKARRKMQRLACCCRRPKEPKRRVGLSFRRRDSEPFDRLDNAFWIPHRCKILQCFLVLRDRPPDIARIKGEVPALERNHRQWITVAQFGVKLS